MICRPCCVATGGAGLEQEGFGIVFLEAAACGVPQVAGDSGGAAEAVAHGETGLVIDDPDDVQAVADAYAQLLDDDELRTAMGVRSRERVETEFSYDVLARRLGETLGGVFVRPPSDSSGSVIVQANLLGTTLFALTAIGAAVTYGAAERAVAAAVALALFFAGIAAFVWSFWNAVQRSRHEQVAVTQLYLLLGNGGTVRGAFDRCSSPSWCSSWSVSRPPSGAPRHPTAARARRSHSGSSSHCSGSD